MAHYYLKSDPILSKPPLVKSWEVSSVFSVDLCQQCQSFYVIWKQELGLEPLPMEPWAGQPVEPVCHLGISDSAFCVLGFSCSFLMTCHLFVVHVTWWESPGGSWTSLHLESPSKPFPFPSFTSHLGFILCYSARAAICKDHRLSDFDTVTETDFLIVLEAKSPQSRYWRIGSFLRPLPSAWRWPPSPSVLTWPFLSLWAFLVFLPFIRTLVLLD